MRARYTSYVLGFLCAATIATGYGITFANNDAPTPTVISTDGVPTAITLFETDKGVLQPGSGWRIDSFVDGDAIMLLPTDTTVTIQFNEDGSVSGSAGCNTFRGTYTLNGGALSFGPLVSTKMACEEAVNDREQHFLKELSGITSYSIDGGRLSLKDANGTRLTANIELMN